VGIFSVRIAVGDPQATRFEDFEAMVDTGSTNTSLPASALRRLGVAPHHKDEFEFADGRIAESDVGYTWVRIDGREALTEVVFAEEDTEPLLGMITLEEMALGIDPIRQVLVPVRKRRK
jgi:clan AA aspartic protease